MNVKKACNLIRKRDKIHNELGLVKLELAGLFVEAWQSIEEHRYNRPDSDMTYERRDVTAQEDGFRFQHTMYYGDMVAESYTTIPYNVVAAGIYDVWWGKQVSN